MSNDKHQAMRDALGHVWAPTSLYTHTIWEKEATPDRVNDLLADHDRMREALQELLNALPSATTHPAIKAAREALREDEQ